MSLSTAQPSRSALRSGSVAAGFLALTLALAACSNDETGAGPEPTSVSIAPTSEPPTVSQVPTTSAKPSASGPASDPSTTRSEKITDLAGAVPVAESVVADSVVVEVSRDDGSGSLEWEATVRAGKNGRELRLASDGSVLSNTSDQLDPAQLGDLPKVTAVDAIEAAEKRVAKGLVDSVELTSENGQRVWDVSVEVAGQDDWELWVDASSGKIVHEERD